MKRLALIALLLGAFGASQLEAQDAQGKASDPKKATEHVVRPGETLGGVANRAGVPRLLIIEANGLKEPYLLRTGQKLVIPRRRSHTVKAGETGFSIALDYGVPWSAIAQANAMQPDGAVKVGQKLVIPTFTHRTGEAIRSTPASAAVDQALAPAPLADTPPPQFVWPLNSKVRRSFSGPEAKEGAHEGIDLLSPLGTAVRASAAGKVIFAGQGPEAYGLTVIIFHGGRWTTTYSFLQKVTVKEGEEVKTGERVGLVGDTGLAEEPQLHFEVRRNRVPLDPAKYLPRR